MGSDIYGLQVMVRKLNELSDATLQNIEDTDMFLAAMQIGVEVFLEEPLAASNGAYFQLGYGNVPADVPDERIGIRCLDGDQWCLLIKHRVVQNADRSGVADDEPSDREKPDKLYPLLQASRDLRILGLKHVPELVEALKLEVARRIHEIQNSVQEISYTLPHRQNLHTPIRGEKEKGQAQGRYTEECDNLACVCHEDVRAVLEQEPSKP